MAAEVVQNAGQGAAQGWGSVLESVVVYASGALCLRRARGTVPPDGRVRLTGLPRTLDGTLLRARVVGGSSWRVTEARLEAAAELRDPQELPELRRRVEQAEESLEAARERYSGVRARFEEIAALRAIPPATARRPGEPPYTGEQPHRRTPADAWLELADFVDERLTALDARARGLADEVRLAEHALAVALEALGHASTAEPAHPVETSAVVALALTGGDGTGRDAEIEVEYGVQAAFWVPSYRLSHRHGDGGGGSLVLRASVLQLSGEDWAGVRLALSTADLTRRTDLPQLRSVRIGRRQPAPAPSGWRAAPAGLSDLFAGYDAAGPRPQARRDWTFGSAAPDPTRSAPAPRGPLAPGAGGLLGVPDEAPAADRFLGHGYGGAAVPQAPAEPGSTPSAPSTPVAPGAPAPYGAPVAYGIAPPPPNGLAAGGPTGPAPGGPPPAMAPRMRMAAPPPAPAPAPTEPTEPTEPAQPTPPRPAPEWLDYATLALQGPEAPPATRGRLLADLAPDLAPGRRAAQAAATAALPEHAVPPRRSAGSFAYRYDAAAPVDIPSTGRWWHTVTIAEVPVELRTEYVCVPSVEETVYATLLLTNPTARPLLAGPVEVSVDGEFLLTAALPTLAPGDTRRVGLGVAEGIRVARRTELRESTVGLLNNVTVLDHRVHVELANRLGHPVTVEVRERVPVTADAEIRIEERPGWTAPGEQHPQPAAGAEPSDSYPPSTRLWRVELPVDGTAELDGGYEIRIPAGKAILGGNRRN
ncbi:DUF4139 domain-containing protein [Saccharothrix sp. ST-888]|uniref:DUF4139 domain-containing protein n=1 Tax=Saccharothrix sp. ST-888 TaxID=1427391 RepID=UPI0018CDF25A|nr:DUF4139 domain-containing protein [Saccharothrix sp. ST-888]